MALVQRLDNGGSECHAIELAVSPDAAVANAKHGGQAVHVLDVAVGQGDADCRQRRDSFVTP
jgi:hypothetical protein